jgi:hypothetical protein
MAKRKRARHRFPTKAIAYTNWFIEAGRVKNSIHRVNTVYLMLRDIEPTDGLMEHIEIDLTNDEAMAIVSCLSAAVFSSTFKKRYPWARTHRRRKI